MITKRKKVTISMGLKTVLGHIGLIRELNFLKEPGNKAK